MWQRIYTKSAGVNLSGSGRRKPKQVQVTPAKHQKVSIAGVYDLPLNLLKEISYVSTRSEQIANANLSMSHGHKALQETNIAIISLNATLPYDFLARHKDNDLPPEGK